MHEITSLELGMAINEIKGKIIGGYLKKFYDLGEGRFRILFHSPDGNTMVYCSLGSTFNETEFAEESGSATNFAIAIRKRIEDSRVINISQYGSDRIFVIELQAKGEAHRLIFEMFGKGNVILIDSEQIIELCFKVALYRDRGILPKAAYVFPKGESLDILRLTDGQINAALEQTADAGGKMIVELARSLNLGPVYLEEIITGAGLNPKGPLSYDDEDKLGESIRKFAERIRSPEFLVYMRDGVPLDYTIVPLMRYKDVESIKYDSLNAMLDSLHIGSRSEGKSDVGYYKEMEEIESSIAKQEELIKEFKDNSVKYAETGKRIFQRMNEINVLSQRIRELKKPSVEQLRSEFPDLNVSEISLKSKKVTIDIE